MVLGFAMNTFAQGGNTTTSNSSMRKMDDRKTGIYVGLTYMNLSDIKMDYKAKHKPTGTKFSDSSTGGTHLGMAGIAAGYDRTPDFGLGFNAGAQLMESFNRSEYGDTKLYIVMPQANLTVAANRMLTAYAGGNVAVWSGSSAANKYQSQLGLQAGLGLRFSKDIALSAGYTMMNQKYETTEDNIEIDAEFRVSGFNSALVYTF